MCHAAAKGHIKLTGLDYRTMRDLNYQLKQLCRNNRDGSYATQALRSKMLSQMANQLFELGYHRMQARSLKPKHVVALTKLWEQQGLSTGTRKNRLSTLRWWAAKVNKQNVVARDNDQYGLARRQYVTNASRVTAIHQEQLDRIKGSLYTAKPATPAGLWPQTRGGDQVPAELRHQGRPPPIEIELVQGRPGPDSPHHER